MSRPGQNQQPARGKFAGQFEDISFRKKADARHKANKAARKARRKARS